MGFYLKNNSSKTSSIYFKKKIDKQIIKFSTRQSVETKLWDKKKQLIKSTTNYNGEYVNKILSEINWYASEATSYCSLNSLEINNNQIKKYVYEKMGWTERKANHSNYLKEYVNTYKSFYTKEYLRRLSNSIARINEFEKIYGKIEFQDINIELLSKFVDWCISCKNYNNSTIQSHVKAWKSILSNAYKNGLHKNITYKSFTSPSVINKEVFLNKEEIKAIKEIRLDNKKLERVRDVFVLNCYLGLRYSDILRLNCNHIINLNEGDHYQFIQKKTSKPVTIFISRYVKEIINKYDGNLPKISNQKFNNYIKEVCRLAGIDNIIRINFKQGAELKEINKSKYSLISSHTGRRSFATNLFLSGFSLRDILPFTGHSSIRQLEVYIKASELDIMRERINTELINNLY